MELFNFISYNSSLLVVLDEVQNLSIINFFVILSFYQIISCLLDLITVFIHLIGTSNFWIYMYSFQYEQFILLNKAN